jgi:hypothetical protein
MYNPIVGRWMEEDPLDFKAGDADKYRYAGNNPTNLTDLSGLQGRIPPIAEAAADEVGRRRREKAMRTGLGRWDAASFYFDALGGPPVYEPAQDLWSAVAGALLNEGKTTPEASKYQEGCYGLVELRIKKTAYDPENYFFTDPADAMWKAATLGPNARIIAIQYTGENSGLERVPDKQYPSRVKWVVGGIVHPGGNHATWHQIGPGNGFWEWSGPKGWQGENWYAGARKRTVIHSRTLPLRDLDGKKFSTVDGVAIVPDHKWRPPLNARAVLTGVKDHWGEWQEQQRLFHPKHNLPEIINRLPPFDPGPGLIDF